MKLRSIYSKEFVEDLGSLRPRTDSIMISRFNAVRRARSCRISKPVRIARVRVQANAPSRPNSTCANIRDDFRYFRNYDEPITKDLQLYLSKYNLPDSHVTDPATVMLDGSSTSKEDNMLHLESSPLQRNCLLCGQIVAYDPPVAMTLQLACGDICHERCLFEVLECPHSIPKTCPSCHATFGLHPRSGIDPSKTNETLICYRLPNSYISIDKLRILSRRNWQDLETDEVGLSGVHTAPISRRGEREEINEAASTRSTILWKMGKPKLEDDIQHLAASLRKRSWSYVELVQSAIRLSMSNSYRSSFSLGHTLSSRSSWMSLRRHDSMSLHSDSGSVKSAATRLDVQGPMQQARKEIIQSGKKIFYDVTHPLSRGEREIWNQLIDEDHVLPARTTYPVSCCQDDLDRACPGVIDNFDNSCSCCGYAIGWYHWHPDNRLGTTTDKSGNTTLHHAANSGIATLALLTVLIDNCADMGARNDSGETFMHILKTKEFIQSEGMSDYFQLLKFLSKREFPFSQRDFHGRNIAHRIAQDAWIFCFENFGERKFEQRNLRSVLDLLNVHMDALDNHGFNAGDEIIHSAKTYAKQHGLKITSLDIEVTKMWCFHHKYPARPKISFRSIIAELEWKPDVWSQRLQKSDLLSWIDMHGDTALTALLKHCKNEDQLSTLGEVITELVELGAEVNMRDRKGYTALAIAVIRGSLSSVQALLDCGADMESKNYRGEDISSVASLRMKRAKREGKSECYARILSCLNMLADYREKKR